MLLECTKCKHITSTASQHPRCSKCQGTDFRRVSEDDIQTQSALPAPKTEQIATIKGVMWKKMSEHMEMMQMIQLTKAMASGTETPNTPQAEPQSDKMVQFMERQNEQMINLVTKVYEGGGDEMGEDADNVVIQGLLEGMKNNPQQEVHKNRDKIAQYITQHPEEAKKMAKDHPALAKIVMEEMEAGYKGSVKA